jgi:hypothetical protein
MVADSQLNAITELIYTLDDSFIFLFLLHKLTRCLFEHFFY